MEYINIALTKGRLAEKTFELFERMGIIFDDYYQGSRKLIFTSLKDKIRVVFVKAGDVPIYVEQGAADIGVAGKDTIMEAESNLYEIMDLGFGRCKFAVAAPNEFEFKTGRKLRVATKYPNVAKNYFKQKGEPIEIIKLSGSVELAPIMGLSDVIVDIVESGKTLQENGLVVLEDICEISARLIINKVSFKTKSEKVEKIIQNFKDLLGGMEVANMRVVNIDESNCMEVAKSILRRSEESFSQIDEVVENIISSIIMNGDKALKEYTEKFDGILLDSIKVKAIEIDEALEKVGSEFIKILEEAKSNIWDYHTRQLRESWTYNKGPGIVLGQLVTPIQRVGIYVPGGKAAYPSTVLMDSIPANVAGVKSIAMVTPPTQDGLVNPYILTAARVCGIDEIYKVGGAQAIAALAYGTETIRSVNKIVGPGNVYVARAKRRVFGTVAIDMIAGPSEICIIADEKANPVFIAADLLSQAEHDEMAAAILVTTSYELAIEVEREVNRQMKTLSRTEIMEKSINNQGVIFTVNNMELAFKLVNEIAPEHLELMMDNPFEYVSRVQNAGAIFLGQYSPESLGDYFAGPNHTLPTSGTAKFSSPLGVDDFIKKSSLIYYEKNELLSVKDKIIKFAENEGLTAHANSIKVRY